jgi:hypothetical protein
LGRAYDQRAIELDPNLAMGYLAVGSDYFGLGEVGRASEYFTKAFQLRGHASEWEKFNDRCPLPYWTKRPRRDCAIKKERS